MLCLINILSSFSSVYEILVDAVATPRMNYTVRQIPEGVIVSEWKLKKEFTWQLFIALISGFIRPCSVNW